MKVTCPVCGGSGVWQRPATSAQHSAPPFGVVQPTQTCPSPCLACGGSGLQDVPYSVPVQPLMPYPYGPYGPTVVCLATPYV